MQAVRNGTVKLSNLAYPHHNVKANPPHNVEALVNIST